MTRRLLWIMPLLLIATTATAQETVTVKLTATQAHAVRVVRGTDVNLTTLVQGWLDNWLVQFEQDALKADREALRTAIEKATPEVEAQVRKMLNAPVPAPVTAEERAARLKAEQDRLAAEQAAKEAEAKRVLAEKEALRASLVAEKEAALKAAETVRVAAVKAEQDKLAAEKTAILTRCAAYNKALPVGAKSLACEALVGVTTPIAEPVIR